MVIGVRSYFRVVLSLTINRMQKASLKDIPKDAIVYSRDEAAGHLAKLVIEHKPETDVLLLKYGPLLNGGLAAFAGVWSLRFYRKAFGLRKELLLSSSLTCGFLPATSTTLYQILYVYPKVLLEEQICPVCLELQSGAIQLVAGVGVPLAMGLLTASMTGRVLGVNVPKATEPLKLIKIGWTLASHPIARYKILALAFGSFLGTMAVLERQQTEMITFKRRLAARQAICDD